MLLTQHKVKLPSIILDHSVCSMFGFTVQISILKEFIFLCYPALFMSQQVFARLICQLGWPKEDVPHVFRAADLSGRCGLSFREFLYVLAAIEPTSSHGGSPGELRCRYIFRFFDQDKDNMLGYNELKNIILVVRKIRKQSIGVDNVSTDVDSFYKSIDFNPNINLLSLSHFLQAVGDLKLRGTSQIFRSTTSIMQYFHNIRERDWKTPRIQNMFTKLDAPNQTNLKQTTPQNQLKGNDYELALHTIKFQKSGAVISIDEIYNIAFAVSPSSTQQPSLIDPYKNRSRDQFDQTSISSELLKGLRYLMQLNQNTKIVKNSKNKELSTYSWGQLDSLQFARNLIIICNQVKDICRGEPRMLDVQSPVYILGDLHGNCGSLLYFEKVLWQLGPALCPSKMLFLGDYVDRGAFGMEVIAYLFCYKVQTPNKLFMLRGNHEIREVQKMFTFYIECVGKFGEKMGVEVWNAINDVFDYLPLAASIDGQLFCCHGGIPPPWLCPTVMAIHSIPCPLNKPDEQCNLAWELMWNDPIKPKQLSDNVALELQSNDGFAVNTKRGTAHVFSVEALEKFLNTNGYSHIIRAHEVAQAGFNVVQKGKLLTVFSSLKYCGGTNEAACILADQGKLRIIRLEMDSEI